MEKVLQTWLFHQCRMLSGSTHAMLLTGPPGEGPFELPLFWPDDRRDHSILSRVAQAALRNKKAVIKTLNNEVEKTGEPLDALAAVVSCPSLPPALRDVRTDLAGPLQGVSDSTGQSPTRRIALRRAKPAPGGPRSARRGLEVVKPPLLSRDREASVSAPRTA